MRSARLICVETAGLQVAAHSGRLPDAVVAGVGTGGTIMGLSRCVRQLNPSVRAHPVEPAEGPVLSAGAAAGGRGHRIAGISDEFIPPVFQAADAADPIPVPDGDAILMAQKLASQLGLGVGISSGANLLAALEAQDRLGPDSVVATVFCDDSRRYLSTDLTRAEPTRPGYRSPHVELLRYEVIPTLSSAQLARVRSAQWPDDCHALLAARRGAHGAAGQAAGNGGPAATPPGGGTGRTAPSGGRRKARRRSAGPDLTTPPSIPLATDAGF